MLFLVLTKWLKNNLEERFNEVSQKKIENQKIIGTSKQ